MYAGVCTTPASSAFNLVSSPGSGKTTLLERTLADLGEELGISVVTGDVQTQNDADRLARHTDRLVQAVVTNGACHLDARQVATALDNIDLERHPSAVHRERRQPRMPRRAGTWARTRRSCCSRSPKAKTSRSSTPRCSSEARYAVLTKMDLLPHVPFSVAKAVDFARQVNPTIEFLFTSALAPDGMGEWYGFLRAQLKRTE